MCKLAGAQTTALTLVARVTLNSRLLHRTPLATIECVAMMVVIAHANRSRPSA